MIDIPLPEIKGFMIYNPKTGLFSKGGQPSPIWSKHGKIWKNIGHLKNHLNGCLVAVDYDYIPDPINPCRTARVPNSYHSYLRNYYVDCVVVDIVTKEPANFSIYEYAREFAIKNWPANDVENRGIKK